MLPVFCLNCIPVIALVVLKYPATKVLLVIGWVVAELQVPIKCFTNVVELGLKILKKPDIFISLSVPTLSASFKCWKPVPCAKSPAALYSKAVKLSASSW